MPTFELRECLWRLEGAAVAVGLAQELTALGNEMPYATNYLYDQRYGAVTIEFGWPFGSARETFRRTHGRIRTHVGLGSLDYSCLLVLTEHQARRLLDFEARAGLTGATPSLARLTRRLAREPPVVAPRSD
jgi:hypothetical protein